MIQGTNQQVFLVTPPAAVNDNTAFATTEVDALGARFVTFIIAFGAMDIAAAVLKLKESDTTGSGFVDISGADFSVSPATLPSATDDNHLFAIHVDMRGRKRFLDLSFTAGDGAVGTYATVIALLSRLEEAPNTAAKRGFTQELFV
jgi:hypothetical protein